MEYTYDDEIRITSEFLNKIDILSYIPKHNNGYTIYKLMDDLSEDYEATLPDDDFFEGILFNRMNTSEFEDYLFERYGKTKIMFNHVEITNLINLTK